MCGTVGGVLIVGQRSGLEWPSCTGGVLSDISTKYRDDGFRVDLSYFGHFQGTKFIGGGSQLVRLLLELEDLITAGQVSAGAGAEARGDWIRGNGRKWLSLSLILWTFTLI